MSEICGDSLTGVGIRDGDFALIHLTVNVRSGDLVAALTPEGMLVKFLSYHNGCVRLESANPQYAPHDYDAADIQIQGKVVRVDHC